MTKVLTTETPNLQLLPDAQERLHNYIEHIKTLEGFSMEVSNTSMIDCARLTRGNIEAQLGWDIFLLEGVKYSSQTSALRWSSHRAKVGKFKFYEALDKYFEQVTPIFAQKGDISVYDDYPNEENSIKRFTLGICLENNSSLVVGTGVGYRDTFQAITVYRVGV
ncbi:MAG: DUF6950 family protein [Waterburya sp.]